MLCQYKNIFGVPGQGLHRYRIFGVALVDLLLTVIVAYFIGDFWKSLIILLLLSVLVHLLFCVDTTVVLFLKKLFQCRK